MENKKIHLSLPYQHLLLGSLQVFAKANTPKINQNAQIAKKHVQKNVQLFKIEKKGKKLLKIKEILLKKC